MLLLLACPIGLACTASFDYDSLQGGEAGVKDAPAADQPMSDIAVRSDAASDNSVPDLGCVTGTPCTVEGAKGACQKGVIVCKAEAGVMCLQTIKPTTEQCDGVDSDCDGVADNIDPDADTACGPKRYCDSPGVCYDRACTNNAFCTNGNTCNIPTGKCVCGSGPICGSPYQCVAGQCLCGGTLVCADGETCAAPGKCVCGSQESTTGPVCQAPNPRCVNDQCRCDGDSICRSNETCQSGSCGCGTADRPTGPFCVVGTICDSAQSLCVKASVDAGLLDQGQDLGVPDQGQADLPPPVDAASTD